MLSFLRRALGGSSTARKSNTVRRSPGSRPRPQLRVEALEERTLLSVGPEFHVNTMVLNDQSSADVACQPALNGRCVVVWDDRYDNGQSPGNFVLAQIYDGLGNRIGGEIIVTFTDGGNQPSVAMDAQGNFVVAWTERLGGINWANIKAQRYFANGTPNGGNISVASDGLRAEYNPSVAMDSSGNFVVSYSLAFSSNNTDVLARRYANNGTFLGSITVAASGLHEYNAAVARSPDGRFSIVYAIDRLVSGGGKNSDIKLNRYSSTGGLLGSHAITSSSVIEWNPEVAMDRNGNTVVVYEQIFSNIDHDIKARKVFSTGFMGVTINVDYASTYEFNPTVAMDLSDGDFVVAYSRLNNSGGVVSGPNQMIVREMNAGGTAKNTFNLGDVSTPALAINDSDVYFVAYVGYNKPGDPWLGIFGRRGFLF